MQMQKKERKKNFPNLFFLFKTSFRLSPYLLNCIVYVRLLYLVNTSLASESRQEEYH